MPRVLSCMKEGWPLTAIYEELQKNLSGITYSQFRRHVRRYAREASHERPNSPPQTLRSDIPFPSHPAGQPRFRFNPDASTLKNKLI